MLALDQGGEMQASGEVGTVAGLWRFPVKSMLGEGLDAVDVTEAGIVGDRAFALVDKETGKVVSAKHPKRWPDLLRCRARFDEPPRPGGELPPVRIDLADGTSVMSVTTVAQDGLERDPNVLKALAKHNRIDVAGGGLYPCAGVYAVVASPGAVRKGDPVAIA